MGVLIMQLIASGSPLQAKECHEETGLISALTRILRGIQALLLRTW